MSARPRIEQLTLAIRETLPKQLVDAPGIDIQLIAEETARGFEMQLRAHIWGKRHYAIRRYEWPATWWDHLKESCLPSWILKWWPARYEGVTIDLLELYPALKTESHVGDSAICVLDEHPSAGAFSRLRGPS